MYAIAESKDKQLAQSSAVRPRWASLGVIYSSFSALCGISVLIWGRDLVRTAGLALHADAYTHILLILPVSLMLALLIIRRRPCRPIPAPRLGLAVLCLALLIAFASSALPWASSMSVDPRLSCEILAFVVWLGGAVVFCFGKAVARNCLFPLLFLLWLVPLPDVARSYVVGSLQQATASITYAMLGALGVPVMKEDTTLIMPGLALQIAEECSSIRSSMMLIVSSMVMSYMLLRSFWARGIVMLAAVPFAVLKNGIRVLTLALLAAYVNPEVLNSPLHRQGGPLFLVVSLLGICVLIWLMGKAENSHSRALRPDRLI